MDPLTEATAQTAVQGVEAAVQLGSSMDASTVLYMLGQAWITTYPMAVASVIALAVILDRWWRYRGLESGTRELTRRLVDLLVKGDLSAARALCDASKTPIGAVFLEGLRWKNIALEDLQSVLSTSRNEAVTELRRRLWILGTIGSLAPFVGLFGTVIGIINAFRGMAVSGSGGLGAVSAGIAEALVTTAFGLFVAIPAVWLYNYFMQKVERYQVEMSNSASELLDFFIKRAGGTHAVGTSA